MVALLGAGSGTHADGDDAAVTGRAESRSSRPVMSAPPAAAAPGGYAAAHLGGAEGGSGAGGMGQRGSELGHEERVRRVLVHASGFRQSPYADIKPQGADAADTRAQAEQETRKQHEQEAQQEKKDPPSKLWHSSPGSSGW